MNDKNTISVCAPRRFSRSVRVGPCVIGGDAPISIQSMTTHRPRDVEATVSQIVALETAGCDLVRVALRNRDDAEALGRVRARIRIPLIADIHFDYRLALLALEQGVDGLRVNPGNLGGDDRARTVIEAAKEREIPIRIGVNAGSLDKRIHAEHHGITPAALVASAMKELALFEEMGYDQVKVSLKASDPIVTIAANRLFTAQSEVPLHLGVTEAGPPVTGTARSAAALAVLLAEGIGDTIRVSLSGDPVQEVQVARTLLESLGLRTPGCRVVACPTCGRCRASDLPGLAARIEQRLQGMHESLTVAIMGCEVNGPGEAAAADLGLACAGTRWRLFAKGEALHTVTEEEAEDSLMMEIQRWRTARER